MRDKVTNILATYVMKIKHVLTVGILLTFYSSYGGENTKNTASDSQASSLLGQEVVEVDTLPIPQNPTIELQTSLGNIRVKLYDETPLHRDNFLKLVREGFYNGVLFHRVIKDFMIQTGNPDSKNISAEADIPTSDSDYTIPAEIVPSLYHKKGVLAAARQSDSVNPQRESSGSQFYIVQGVIHDDATLNRFEEKSGMKYTEEQRDMYKAIGGTPHLDGGYTVFGEVVSGMEIVDAIAGEPVNKQNGDRPVDNIVLVKAFIVRE